MQIASVKKEKFINIYEYIDMQIEKYNWITTKDYRLKTKMIYI